MKNLPLLMLILPLGVLAACGSDAPQSERAAAPVETRKPAADSGVPSIVGEWRLAGIDGADPDWPFGVAVSIDATKIAIRTPCSPMDWTYRYDGAGGLVLEKESEMAVAINESMQCVDGPLVEERTLFGLFNGFTRVRANPDGSITLSGRGHDVTLFSQ